MSKEIVLKKTNNEAAKWLAVAFFGSIFGVIGLVSKVQYERGGFDISNDSAPLVNIIKNGGKIKINKTVALEYK